MCHYIWNVSCDLTTKIGRGNDGKSKTGSTKVKTIKRMVNKYNEGRWRVYSVRGGLLTGICAGTYVGRNVRRVRGVNNSRTRRRMSVRWQKRRRSPYMRLLMQTNLPSCSQRVDNFQLMHDHLPTSSWVWWLDVIWEENWWHHHSHHYPRAILRKKL